MSTAHARCRDLHYDPEGHGYQKRKQVDYERTNYWIWVHNSHPTNFCYQLLRCLVCIVSWCTRSVHAVNDRVHGRKHGRVRFMDGPCTWPVHGRVHSLYMAVDGRIYGPQTRPRTGYTTVYTVVYLYTAVFTARVQGRPWTGYGWLPFVTLIACCKAVVPCQNKTRAQQ